MTAQNHLLHPPAPAIPDRLKPAHRLREVGSYNLSDAELLAVILGHDTLDTANAILAHYTLNDLAELDLDLLTRFNGVGPATVNKLTAALALTWRIRINPPTDYPQIRAPQDALTLLQTAILNRRQEHFIILNLDTRNKVQKIQLLYTGTVNTSLVRIAEVFAYAIATNCPSIIVAHYEASP